MPNLEWEVPHTLTSPLGSLAFNTILGGTTGPFYCYLVQPDSYKIVPAIRVTQDNISQQSGSVLHPRFTSGLVATIRVEYVIFPTGNKPTYEPACGADLRLMHEGLMKHIQALLVPNPTGDPNTTQRLLWTPTDLGDQRLIQAVQTLAWAEPSWQSIGWAVDFSLESPYPFAIDSTPNAPVSLGGGPTLVPNAGDAPFWPVIQIGAGATNFTITNEDDPSQTIVFDSSRPGAAPVGGSGAPIVTFDGTFYNGGAGADLIAGFDPTQTEFWPIQAGGTNMSVTGATATITTNNAYC